jgi:gluconolactonase
MVIAGVIASAHAQSPSSAPQMRGDGPPPAARPFRIERADPALDAIVDPRAKLELMASGFGLNEGPVWVPEGAQGYLLVGGLIDNVLYKITPDNKVSVFLESAGYTGDDVNHVGTQTRSGRAHVLLIGPTCAGLDSQGRLVWCASNDGAVMRLEKDGKRTVLAGGSEGKKFSGPNDLVIRRDDALYFTDTDFGLRDAGKSPLKELPNGVWLVKEGRPPLMVIDDKTHGGIPNGIALSPDERFLYVTAGRKLKRYAVNPDGTLGESTVFAEGDGIGDGIKVDTHGNVFSSSGGGPGVIRITSADGKFLGALHLPIYGGEPKKQICATNEAFGGPDRRTLFITACDAVYKIRMKTAGL